MKNKIKIFQIISLLASLVVTTGFALFVEINQVRSAETAQIFVCGSVYDFKLQGDRQVPAEVSVIFNESDCVVKENGELKRQAIKIGKLYYNEKGILENLICVYPRMLPIDNGVISFYFTEGDEQPEGGIGCVKEENSSYKVIVYNLARLPGGDKIPKGNVPTPVPSGSAPSVVHICATSYTDNAAIGKLPPELKLVSDATKCPSPKYSYIKINVTYDKNKKVNEGFCVIAKNQGGSKYQFTLEKDIVTGQGVRTCAFLDKPDYSVHQNIKDLPGAPTGGGAGNGGTPAPTGKGNPTPKPSGGNGGGGNIDPTNPPQNQGSCDKGFHQEGPLCIPDNPFNKGVASSGDVKGLVQRVIQIALYFAGIVAVIMIIIGGYQVMTAGGDSAQASNGKKTLTNALIGLAIVVLSYTIVTALYNFLIK